MTSHPTHQRHHTLSAASLGLVALCTAALSLAPDAALADAESSNTLSLTLSFTPVQTNLFGYAYTSAGAGSVTSNPGGASLTITVPQDVVFVTPNNSDSKTTATSFKLNMANLSGSGPPTPTGAPYDPQMSGTLTYDLNNSLIDNPTLDSATSSYFINVFLNNVIVYTDTLTSASPQDLSGTTAPFAIPISLPANSISKLVVQLGLSAEASSYQPPAPPPSVLPPPPPPPVYPPVPEPTTWALMIVGLGLVGGAARRRRVIQAT